LHQSGHSGLLEEIPQTEGIHHSSEHSHIIGIDPIHTAGAAHYAAPDISGTDNESDFYALIHDIFHLPDHGTDGGGIITMFLISFKRLAADFEKYTVETEFFAHNFLSFPRFSNVFYKNITVKCNFGKKNIE
jgi:hypothetical protein